MKRQAFFNLIIVGLFIFNLLPLVFADNLQSNEKITLHIFYGKGCSHCETALIFLDKLMEEYPSLVVEEHEVYSNQKERELFEQIANAFEEKIEGVPTIFIDNKIFIGFSNNMANSIEQEIKRCNEIGCDNPVDKIKDKETVKLVGESSSINNPEKTTVIKKLTVPAVFLAAIVDAINPCAFAVLIILMSTILASRDRRKALLSGLAFSLSIFISYFLMGLGLYSAIQASGLSHTFYIIVSILAIFIGLFNLKDYLWYGKWFVMEVPISWRPKLKLLITSITSVPGAFAIGFIVSLFLLPCTSGPYIVILGLLAEATTRVYATFLLIIYNIVFISPMIIITLALFFGFTTTKKAEKLRKSKLKALHLIAGIIILFLGIGMLIAIRLGAI